MSCRQCDGPVPIEGYLIITIEEGMGRDDAGNVCSTKYEVEFCSYKCVREYFSDW
jgi:hypothetical protein